MNTFSVILAIIIAILCLGPKSSHETITKKGFWSGRDNTDTEDKRSGVHVITDYGTGVQYLVTPLGGITPRIDKDGRPIQITEQRP